MSNEWLKNDKPLANQHGDGAYDLPATAPAPTGRELDVLIAEKVFGLVRCQSTSHSVDFPSDYCYALPDSPDQGGEVKEYSTDIAAAWLIVEHLQKTRTLSLVIGLNACANGHQNGAKFYKGSYGLGHSIFDASEHPGWDAVADSVPLAICRAAITAVSAAPGRADD